ncbi:hypothetical protein [Gaetbulibacter saemankumensis]|uniref:hypothetical protein n=1 Tax=Gaetbulibacter saemankumensis TaxID=311208 RepID=UPI0004048EC2|nr:hypothetical protein [Gaetbulibacter saemankumensis]
MKIKLPVIFSCFILFIYGCEEPLDPIIEAVDKTNATLQKYDWQLVQFLIDVKDEDIPPPLLFDSSDALIREGKYDLDDMVLDASDMQTYTVNFTKDRKIITTGGQIDLFGDDEPTYFVVNQKNIRINAEEALIYDYIYDTNRQEMNFTVNEGSASRLIEKINQKLVDNVANRTPTKIGNAIAKLLFNNESLQKLINDVIVDAISGKLEFINEFDPDEAARLLAKEILNALQQVDWEGKLTELLKVELEKITNIDPDQVSEEIANEIANFVNERISEEGIYNLLLPYVEQIPTNSEQIAETIATLVVNLFFEVFDEDTVQPVLTAAWERFTELDEQQVGVISDTLAYYVQDIWVNQENISNIILPFTERIDETSIFEMGALATEATNAIKDLVDLINEKFEDVNLAPDYDSMQSTIKAAFIAAKPLIGLAGGPENAANDVANLLLSQFLNKENISSVFTSGINYLQSIDSELAGTTITRWLLSLEPEISPVIITYLRDLLSPILDNINPELTTFIIAKALNSFVEQNVTPENLKTILFPILDAFANLNAEAVANFIAKQILALDIIKDTITEENIAAILLPILESIQQTDVEQVVQNLIDAIVASGIFEDTITEERVATIISILIYKASWDNVQIANNFKSATIVLRHD